MNMYVDNTDRTAAGIPVYVNSYDGSSPCRGLPITPSPGAKTYISEGFLVNNSTTELLINPVTKYGLTFVTQNPICGAGTIVIVKD